MECQIVPLRVSINIYAIIIYLLTYNSGLEGRFQHSTIQLLPVYASEEGVVDHGVLTALRGHTAETSSWVLGQ